MRAGAIFEPTKEQSYYVSYSTSFNPSLEQLTSTTGNQNLPPENNEGYEAGVKYEFLNGNLSTNGAIFQITKYNARTQNADGTFTPTGTVQVKGVRVGGEKGVMVGKDEDTTGVRVGGEKGVEVGKGGLSIGGKKIIGSKESK